ncbi:MAG: Asp-tRNA(Asn)/Glu-tRNA(Gln) amidotransferase subunit GatA [Bacteroidetes bacterium]|jgi:aspartyl-tRNA(Asn)/glutamyl-tRNA(Gln) amidotransferase subunit A|nr:Asp-tRNA(Asn)/Glu-tRNA(Gln) amidotransferase subunit GatA [Bacteroidota bacterium]
MDLYRSLENLQVDLLNKKISCAQLVDFYLQRIESFKALNAFVEVFENSAIEKAKQIDKKIEKGESLGKLFGMVIGIKDNICYKDHKVTAGSKILDNYTSIYSATVVEKLLEEDAIIIGRTNCDEFAMGSSNENSFYGPTCNPIDEKFVPGGSSGGSAAAVKAGLCLATLGSDTGGSIRQPAAFCGIFGLKPTYGRVSRYGLIAYGSSFDQIGPMANNISDIAKILEVISGSDDYDSTVSFSNVPAYSQQLFSNKKYKIAYYKDAVEHPSIDSEIKDATLNFINKLTEQGHLVEGIEFNEIDYIVPAYYVLTTAEASSNLSRFDGVRYGFHATDATDLESTYRNTRSQGFGKEVQKRIMSGAFVLSAGYYDAYYSKAQKVRRIIANKTNETFKQYDFILCPTTPAPAYKLGEKSDDPIAMYLGDIFTVQANLVGVPGISIPYGNTKSGLPIGLQLMAGKFEEAKLLDFSSQIEKY